MKIKGTSKESQGRAEVEMESGLSKGCLTLSLPLFNFGEKLEEPFKVRTDWHISTEDEVYTPELHIVLVLHS